MSLFLNSNLCFVLAAKCCEYLTVTLQDNSGGAHGEYTIGNGTVNGKNYWTSSDGTSAIWFLSKETRWTIGEKKSLGRNLGWFFSVFNTPCPHVEAGRSFTWKYPGTTGGYTFNDVKVECGWNLPWSGWEIFGFVIAGIVGFIILCCIVLCTLVLYCC